MIPTPSATSNMMNSEKPMQAPIIVPSSDVGGLVETVLLLVGSGSEELEGKGGRDGGMEGWRGREEEREEGGEGEGEREEGGEGEGKREEEGDKEIS